MADDTRIKEDLSRDALTVDKSAKPFAGSQWSGAKENETFAPGPPASANAMAGGTEHTAGGKMKEVSIGNAFERGLKMEDFTELRKRPCVREGFLTGIGVGFALGGLGLVLRSTIWRACNITVFTGLASSGLHYQYCLYKRQQEKEGMMRAVEILNKKEVEKKARADQKERAREERRRLSEEKQDQRFKELAGERDKDKGSGGGWGGWKFW